MRRLFDRLLCALVVAALPSVAAAVPRLELLTPGPLVGGTAAAVITVEVSDAHGPVRFSPNRTLVLTVKPVTPTRYELTFRLASYRLAFQFLLVAIDGTGSSQPVVIDVVAGVMPSLGRSAGSIVAGQQSQFSIETGQVQRPLTVFLDNADITADTTLEGNLLMIRPHLIAPPSDCRSTLKVVNVSQAWRVMTVPVVWPPPSVTGVQGDVFAGQPSHVFLEGADFTTGSVVFVEAGGRRITPPAQALGNTRLAIDLDLPAVATPYRARIGVKNTCGAEDSFPVQVKIPQNVQPTITAITAGTVAAGTPIALTVTGKDFLPAMQVFVSLAGGTFAEVKNPRITTTTVAMNITIETIAPKTGAMVRVRVVNPGDGSTSTTRDVALTLSTPAAAQGTTPPSGR